MTRQREPRLYDAGFLAFLRTQRCCCCGRHPPVQAAHIRIGLFAKGMKPHDKNAVPLCSWCHLDGPQAQHKMNEESFWKMWELDPFAIAAKLYAEYGGAGGAPKKKRKLTTIRPKGFGRKIRTRTTPWPKNRKIPSRKFAGS